MPTLQLGDSGTEVSDLQDRLYRLGYELYGGGEFDTYTEAAVRRFQTDCGLDPTGVADDGTLAYLSQGGESSSTDAGTESATGQLVAGSEARVVDGDGTELATGTLLTIDAQGERTEMASPAREMVEDLLRISPYTAFVPAALDLANALGWTVAVGVDGDVIAPIIEPLGVGLTGGGGIYFAPGDTWGLYSSLGADFGLATGVSGGGCFTVVNGGSDQLAGTFWALEVAGGSGFGGGFALLFNSSLQFVGVAGEIGVCTGFPINFFASWSYTFLQPL